MQWPGTALKRDASTKSTDDPASWMGPCGRGERKRRLKWIESSGCWRRRLAGGGNKNSPNYTLAPRVIFLSQASLYPDCPSPVPAPPTRYPNLQGTGLSSVTSCCSHSAMCLGKIWVASGILDLVWSFKAACILSWESRLLCLLHKFREIKKESFLCAITSL